MGLNRQLADQAVIKQKLSPRLMALANLVPDGTIAADIGTDHAYIPIYLVATGKCRSAIGGDVHQGPFQAAQKAVQEFGLTDYISIRLGDGLAVLQPAEADVAVIAGMGGGTIRDILEAQPQIARNLSRLILQPMVDAWQLRSWLLQQGWQLLEEDLVEEEDRLYEIIVAVQEADRCQVSDAAISRVPESAHDQVILEVGPRLLQNKHPLLPRHIDKLIQDKARVVQQISNSQSPAAQQKAELFKAEIAKLEQMKSKL